MLKGAAALSTALSPQQRQIATFIQELLDNNEDATHATLYQDAIHALEQPLSHSDIHVIAQSLHCPLAEILPRLAAFTHERAQTHQNPPPFPHGNALLSVEAWIALTTFYKSPGTFAAYSASVALAKLLSPVTARSQLLGNLILICTEMATDFGPFNLGNTQMDILVEKFGVYAYLIPPVALLLWKKMPSIVDAVAESEMGIASQDFCDLMYGHADDATYEQYQDCWMAQSMDKLGSRALQWLFGTKQSISETPSIEPAKDKKRMVAHIKLKEKSLPTVEGPLPAVKGNAMPLPTIIVTKPKKRIAATGLRLKSE